MPIEKYQIPLLPLSFKVKTMTVMEQTIIASRKLAELKGIVRIIPQPAILIRTLSLQEAKDSSAVESIITTHDELYRAEIGATKFMTPAAKEVSTYADALLSVISRVRDTGLITENVIKSINEGIKHNNAGYVASPDKALINDRTKEKVYTPPSTIHEIEQLMSNLVRFINDDEICDLDPLVKMAIIHHQFESIHPFGDGNGRVGRVLNILYLMAKGLLDYPILYLSRYIIQNKDQYYALLQSVREFGNWEEWIIFILKGVEQTASETIEFVKNMEALMMKLKHRIRNNLPGIYSQDLINNLFRHPYTKIEFVVNELNISRPTATSYLNQLIKEGILNKFKMGRENYYINKDLFDLILHAFHQTRPTLADPIMSNIE